MMVWRKSDGQMVGKNQGDLEAESMAIRGGWVSAGHTVSAISTIPAIRLKWIFTESCAGGIWYRVHSAIH